VLTVVGIVLIVTVYGGLYWGFTKVTELAGNEIAKANPDFEMLKFSMGGKMRVRHKATGKEFSIVPPQAKGGRIELRPLTTKQLTPVPAWIVLKDASPATGGTWNRMGDTGILIEALQDLFADHDFMVEFEDQSTITACNSKLLQCAVIGFGNADGQDNRSWYSASFFGAP
jgi:hypothetical protein